MEEVIYYYGEDIETSPREKLIECIRFCKKDIDRREEMDIKRMKQVLLRM